MSEVIGSVALEGILGLRPLPVSIFYFLVTLKRMVLSTTHSGQDVLCSPKPKATGPVTHGLVD